MRAGLPETVAMKINDHRSRSLFNGYKGKDYRRGASSDSSDEMINDPAFELVDNVAERVGFEPTVQFPRQQFSRLPDSATLAPLREGDCSVVFG